MFINERINSLRETNPEATPDETPKDSASLMNSIRYGLNIVTKPEHQNPGDDEQKSGYLTPLGVK